MICRNHTGNNEDVFVKDEMDVVQCYTHMGFWEDGAKNNKDWTKTWEGWFYYEYLFFVFLLFFLKHPL